MKFDWLSLLIPSTQFQRKHEPLNSEHIISGTTKIMAVISLFIRKEEICLQLEKSFFAIFLSFSPDVDISYLSFHGLQIFIKAKTICHSYLRRWVVYCTVQCTCHSADVVRVYRKQYTTNLMSFPKARFGLKVSLMFAFRRNVQQHLFIGKAPESSEQKCQRSKAEWQRNNTIKSLQ